MQNSIVVLTVLLICFYSWYVWTTGIHKASAIVGSSVFSVLETFWTGVGYHLKASGYGSKQQRPKYIYWPGHTTFAQWWANVLYTPILLHLYRYLLLDSATLRVVLFPLNIWLLELVEGYAMMWLFSRNLAWYYDTSDSMFDGNIRLAYAIPWWFLGVVVEFLWGSVLVPVSEAVEPHTLWLLAIAVPLTIAMPTFLGWPLLCIPKAHDA